MSTYEPTWAIIDACVPRGTAEKLARCLSRSTELINRWKRPPEDDENPSGTGSLSPLDIVEAIQDHAFAHAPAEAHRIHHYFQRRYEKFTEALRPAAQAVVDIDREINDVVREHAELLQAVLLKSTPETVRREWEQLKIEGEQLVRLIEAQRFVSRSKIQSAGKR